MNTILDAFDKESEFADFSLSGKPWHNIKGNKTKLKIST